MSRNRSNGPELSRRAEKAAELLANGVPRTVAVCQLAEQFKVDRRTARRYVAAAAALLAEEIGTPDLQAAMAETVERLRRLSHLAERNGNLNAAVGAEKAAAVALVSLYRADSMASVSRYRAEVAADASRYRADLMTTARLDGHTFAMAEPSEAQRRRHRQSIREPPF